MEDLKDRLNSDVEEVAADTEYLLERTRENQREFCDQGGSSIFE